MEKSKRILFILKFRSEYGHDYGKPKYSEGTYSAGGYFSSGLFWSAKFVVDMLNDIGFTAKLVQVVDNNDIDREVTKFRPDIVVVEALWVVPEKFDVLKKLHPHIIWIVRLHSNIPFLAGEGIAISWIKGYVKRGVYVAVNSHRAFNDIRDSVKHKKFILYLPNFYPVQKHRIKHCREEILHVGCYGAIRPMKNQLIQAIAAIKYADSTDQTLVFHINSGRVEQGDSVLKNLRALFADSPHTLQEDAWMTHAEFIRHLRVLDVGMQVSLSETFCIVAADMVNAGIPVVVSPEVEWAGIISKAHPTDQHSIFEALSRVLKNPKITAVLNRRYLKQFSKKSKRVWRETLGD